MYIESDHIPNFGYDVPKALRGLKPSFLQYHKTGPCTSCAEGNLSYLYTQDIINVRPVGRDTHGRTLPLPLLTLDEKSDWIEHDTKNQSHWAMGKYTSNDRLSIVGHRYTADLFFYDDGSILLIEALGDGNYVALPLSLFLSHEISKGDMKLALRSDVDLWCETMRYLPVALQRPTPQSISKMSKDQVIPPWLPYNQGPPISGASSENDFETVAAYLLAYAAYVEPGSHAQVSMPTRMVHRDGSIGPAKLQLSAKGQKVDISHLGCLEDIADHPNFHYVEKFWIKQGKSTQHPNSPLRHQNLISKSLKAKDDITPHDLMEMQSSVNHWWRF